jgi:hypothetical protein
MNLLRKLYCLFSPSRTKRKNNLIRVASSLQCSTDGFNIITNNAEQHIQWRDIKKITAYKVDLFTTDEICMDIMLAQDSVTISEEAGGWPAFSAAVLQQFPSILKDWEGVIAQPPFATNLTILYEASAK